MRTFTRWTSLLLSGLLAAGPICASGETPADLQLALNPANTSPFNDGIFEGWGTSLCWWANRIGYSDILSQKAAEAFCDPAGGLGLRILRYNIGGGDDPSHDHITRTDSMMPGFWKNPSVQEETGSYAWEYDWSQDANQRNVLERCLAVYGDGMLVEAFSNSPPYFMTNSGCSSGAKLAFQNNLKEDAYDAFARYLADVAEHFASEWGIRFQSIAPMNEPNTNYWSAYSNKQEGCHQAEYPFEHQSQHADDSSGYSYIPKIQHYVSVEERIKKTYSHNKRQDYAQLVEACSHRDPAQLKQKNRPEHHRNQSAQVVFIKRHHY